MIYADAIEGMHEYDVGLTDIVDEDFVLGRATKVNVACIEG
jgi:hypothetical protein